jgi:hypothetical protein
MQYGLTSENCEGQQLEIKEMPVTNLIVLPAFFDGCYYIGQHQLKIRCYFYFTTVNTLERLNPNRISAFDHLLVVVVINAFSFIPVELEKCNWNT